MMQDPLKNGPFLLSLQTAIEDLPKEQKRFIEELFYRTYLAGYYAGLENIWERISKEKLETPYPWADWPVEYGKIVKDFVSIKEQFKEAKDPKILQDNT